MGFLSAPTNFLAQWFRNFDSKILGLTILSMTNGRMHAAARRVLVADKWGRHYWGRCKSKEFWTIGEKVQPGTLGKTKVGQRECPTSPSVKNMKVAVTPLVLTPFVPFRMLLRVMSWHHIAFGARAQQRSSTDNKQGQSKHETMNTWDFCCAHVYSAHVSVEARSRIDRCVYIYIYIYTHTHVYMCIHLSYIYIYIYTHTSIYA